MRDNKKCRTATFCLSYVVKVVNATTIHTSYVMYLCWRCVSSNYVIWKIGNCSVLGEVCVSLKFTLYAVISVMCMHSRLYVIAENCRNETMAQIKAIL